jgi:hypothetical protein
VSAGRAAVVLGVLVLAAAVALAWDDVGAHRLAAGQARRADDGARALARASDRASELETQLAQMRTDNSQLQAQARNPTLSMWNSCGGPCSIDANSVRVGSVPDTFELQIDFTADVPVRAYVFTFHQWTQFDGCGLSTRCVTGTFRTYDATTQMSQHFTDAEGCSGYVWVLQADRAGTINPDVKVHYQPADHPTGACLERP